MAMNIATSGRTCWVGEPQVITGNNGRQSTKVLFRIAVNQRKPKTVQKPDGSTEKQEVPGFWLCSAVGPAAEAIVNFASAKKPDGKVYSRLLEITGELIKFKPNKPYQTTVSFTAPDTQHQYNLNVNIPGEELHDDCMILVDNISFLDKRPVQEQGGSSVSVTVQGSQQPQNGQPAPAGQSQSAMNPHAQPVTVQAGQTPAPNAQNGQPQQPSGFAPVVPENFDPGSTPF